MEFSKDNQLMELVVSTRAATSYHDLLEAQYELFQTQIEKLQNIVATQCKLTGANPLSQEMAAGALSIKIGKRPRDLLNPKAVKYMQFVFSIKDAISKRETREISAHFGVTATQVREFFAGQRSRVRKSVRLSREKADRSNTCNDMHEGIPSTSDPNMAAEPVPMDTILPISCEEGPSWSMQTEFSSGKEKSDKQFIYNIFHLMRNEESFSGQVKLLEWILQMKKTAVLHWFLTEGGVMILATWLSQAATEEQTSVLHVILKVLCHLPLHKALPVHMSAILQSVNRLRFYRSSDISNRARTLLSRWSKMFANSQISSKLNGIKSVVDAQDEMLLKQSINEVMGRETWDSNADNSELIPKLSNENPDNFRMLESRQKLKLLTGTGEDSNKRRGVFSSHMRERRKVKMVEHPGQRVAVNSPNVAKSTPATQSRPLSADDIQKAKIRAQFMQNRYRKSDDNAPAKPDSQLKCISSQSNVSLSIPKSVQPDHDEQKKLDNALLKVSNEQEIDHSNLEEPPWKKYRRIQIPWQTPPALEIRATWLVGTGENSKEVEVQKNRIRREREIIYRTIQEIPLNPREPWDCEMDFDDTLTPEIPIEQLPDVEPLETPQVSVNDSKESVGAVAPSTSHGAGGSVPEPDLELLAELLKNPQLVFALTSGQAGDLSSNETVKLLDMIKNNGVTSLSKLAGLGGKADNKVEVSLPSPTPSSDPVPNGMKPDFSRNPFSRQHTMATGGAYKSPGTALPVRLQEKISPSTLVQPRTSATSILTTHLPPISSLQSSMQLPEQWQLATNPSVHRHSSPAQHLAPEMMLNMNTVINRTPPNLLVAASPVIPAENFGNANRSPAAVGISSARLVPAPTPATLHPQKQPQQPYVPEPTVSHSLRARPGYNSIKYHSNNPTLNSYNVYTGGPARAAVSTWERNELAERPEFESWSPDNSPRRHYEYIPGQKYPEPRTNLRHEDGPERERAMPRTTVQPSSYWDQSRGGAGNKRPRDNRR